MKRTLVAMLAVLLGLSLFSACGQKSAKPDETTAPAPAPSTSPAPSPAGPADESEGLLVAKEILATFDAAVAETAEAAKSRPEGAELKAKVEAIFAAYKPKMEELNTRYLALRDKDIRLFGEANGYMGENRGRHVYRKDVTLGDALAYYNLQKSDQASVDLLSRRLIELIDIAVKM